MKVTSQFIFGVMITIFLVATSCKSSKLDTSTNVVAKVIDVENTAPHILMVIFSINDDFTISGFSFSRHPGKLRSITPIDKSAREGSLLLSFIGQNGDICREIVLDDPLTKHIEYSEQDNAAQMLSKTVTLQKGEVTVRLQEENCFDAVKIARMVGQEWMALGQFGLK